MISAAVRSSETAPRPSQNGSYAETNGMMAAARLMLTNESAIAVITCTTTNTTASSDRFRCRPRTANRGSPGSRPCRLTRMPMSITADSSTRLTTPVARLAYQSAVLDVMPLITSLPR